MEEGDRLTVILLVGLIAFAVLIVDERWLRAAIAFVPALLLAQRAMRVPGVPVNEEVLAGTEGGGSDDDVRGHIEELLKLFREFYTTCHLMASGSLEPEAAREMAGGIERSLNTLLAQVTGAGPASPDSQGS